MTLRRALAIALVLVLTGGAGCGQILGVADYRVGKEMDAASGAEETEDGRTPVESGIGAYQAVLLFNGKGSDECDACLSTSCSEEIQRLLEHTDSACPNDLDVVTCTADLPVWPGSADVCGLCPPLDEPQSPLRCLQCPLAELGTCQSAECPMCAFGRDFACSGMHAWPDPRDARHPTVGTFPIPVDVWVGTSLFQMMALPEARVQMCARAPEQEPWDEDCALPISDIASTDPNGVARLHVKGRFEEPTTIVGHDAYLLVHETPSTWPERVYFNRPWSITMPVVVVVRTKAGDAGRDDEAGVTGAIVDCRGASNWARGVQVTLERDDGLPPPPVAYGYDRLESEHTGNDGWFVFPGLAGTGANDGVPTMATVRIEDAESDTVLVKGFRFPIRPMTYQTLRLFPDATNFPPD